MNVWHDIKKCETSWDAVSMICNETWCEMLCDLVKTVKEQLWWDKENCSETLWMYDLIHGSGRPYETQWVWYVMRHGECEML